MLRLAPLVLLVVGGRLSTPTTIGGGGWEQPKMTDEDVQGQDVPRYLACDACRAVVGHAHSALRRAEAERGGKQLSEAAAMEVLEERVCQFNRKKLLDVDPDSFWHEYGVKLVDGGPRQGEKVLDGDAVRTHAAASKAHSVHAATPCSSQRSLPILYVVMPPFFCLKFPGVGSASRLQLPANKKLPGVKRGGGSTLPGRLSRRCAELVGEVGEDELYALLRNSWSDTEGGVEAADGAYGGEALEVVEGVVCTELSSWCGEGEGGKSKGKKKKKKKGSSKKEKKQKQKKKKPAE
jgi:hypothetical protein